MRGFLTALCLLAAFAPGPARADPSMQESVVLAQVVGDRLAKALAGLPYTVSKVCTPQDCSLIIEMK